MSKEAPSFEYFLDELEETLLEIDEEGYRLRRDLGDTHDWFLQAGGDFNAYLDESRDPTFHEINSVENWTDESHEVYRILDDQYDL